MTLLVIAAKAHERREMAQRRKRKAALKGRNLPVRIH